MATATTFVRNLRDPMKAQRVISRLPSVAHRLSGAGTVLEDQNTKWRIDVQDFVTLTAVVNVSAGGQGAATLDLFAMAANATADDADSAVRLLDISATQVAIANAANATQEAITLDVTKLSYVELVLTAGTSAGDNVDYSFVDIFLA